MQRTRTASYWFMSTPRSREHTFTPRREVQNFSQTREDIRSCGSPRFTVTVSRLPLLFVDKYFQGARTSIISSFLFFFLHPELFA